MRGWAALVAAVSTWLFVSGCTAPTKSVDVQAANEMRKQENVVVIDVREPNEYAAGHIPEATLIPQGQIEQRLAEIPKDKQVLLVCRSGRRSGEVTRLLTAKGYDAQNMAGGMLKWAEAGFEVRR
jgi:rhodanese-related sulfurtransferase